MHNIHVIASEFGWTVEHAGGGDGTTFPSQEEAICSGTAQAKREHVDLLIHGLDGEITERRSFGNDSPDIKG
ncbi:DUF2188 domain-containing protein [Cupriavidus sp. SS-3]|uniref:DUF2188 domain-containing protein n=1 Tax=Cupriavidus sp. SS-3 TaxID=3109596 RepID=UPI002DBCCD81|nr:DUF2188 domain-containing protein [Cupriavidus sp. SS-3]MEC3766893.1 DUF2188 domain-containing protein [Cupriavidus sp. SS-3]